MSCRTGSLIVCMLVAAGGARAGEVEVTGPGWAAPAPPPVTNHPPPDAVDSQEAHDVQGGVVLDGTEHYSLQQGAHDDDKRRWASTDYIHWRINGATLRAKGQVHDADASAATIAESAAWGAQITKVHLCLTEGDVGTIRADNRVSFKYGYLFTGQRIAEASVQLTGAAYDIFGNEHTFNLSDQRGETVTLERDVTTGQSLEHVAASGAVISTEGMGIRAGSSTKLVMHEQIHLAVSRRLARADGDTGSSAPALLEHEISGPTPLDRTYEVYSDASVTLRARTAEVSEVTVKLERFKVENSLRAWKSGLFKREPDDVEPPPPTDPGGGGPTTPGSDDDGDGHGGGSVEEGGERWQAGGDDAFWSLQSTAPVPLPVAGGLLAVATIREPYGLDGQAGTLPGLVRVTLDCAAPRDLAFAVVLDPADLLHLAEPGRIAVEAGESSGSLAVHGATAGMGSVTLQLLDECGAPTGAALELAVVTRSVFEHPQPRLWATVAGKAWRPGRGVAVRGLRGTDIGPLRVGRLGFAAYLTSDTDVEVAVDDPDRILAGLPSAVTIPAGRTATSVPLALTGAAGTARITLASGDERIEVVVLSLSQRWRSVPVVRIPLGSTAPLPYLLERPERDARTVQARSNDPVIAVLDGEEGDLRPGESAWFFRLRGQALGTTTVTLSTDALEPLTVRVEVVPPLVEIRAGKLRIADLPVAPEGEIHLRAPEGVFIEVLEAPADSGDFLRVLRRNDAHVVLAFMPGPDAPAELALPIRFSGSGAGELRIEVLDTVHEAADRVRNSYQLEVR